MAKEVKKPDEKFIVPTIDEQNKDITDRSDESIHAAYKDEEE
jgi:hypothetical protein